MAITRGTLQIARRLRRDIGTEVDDATRTLTHEWVQAWDKVAPAWLAAADQMVAAAVRLERWPRPAEIMRMGQVDQVMRATATQLRRLAERTETVATDGADRIIQLDAEREARIIAAQAPDTEQPALSRMLADRTSGQAVEALREAFALREQARDEVRATVLSRIRTDAVDRMVTRTGQQIHSAALPLSDEAVGSMRRELVRGIDVGDNPRQAARRMVTGLEREFNGGLSRALNISRTEMLDAYRGTSAAIHQANQDIVPGWQWLATFDRRVCPSCLSQHGTQHPTATPGPEDHQQGRCARLPVLTSWAELGITAPEPPSVVPDAQTWFSTLSRAAQLRIMGPARLQLLDEGRISWSDLSTRRDNPRWRPSHVPTPVRDLRRRADRTTAPTQPTVATRAPFQDRLATAATEQAALDAATAGLDRPGPVRLTRPQRNALRDYESSLYVAINGQLRRREVESLIRRRVGHIDTVMTAATLATSVAVWRGIADMPRVFGDAAGANLAGAQWTELGYLSTSANPRIADEFAAPGSNQAVMQILVPAGTGAVRISGLDLGQGELLLQRNLRLRVVSDTGPGSNPRRLTVEVLP